jgi:hypothetical protein
VLIATVSSFASLLVPVLIAGLICPSIIVAGTNTFNEKSIKQWTLKGPLSELPERISEVLPLSDQQNKVGWMKFEPMWDEFDQPTLDTNKWTIGMYWWQGRQPAWFNPRRMQTFLPRSASNMCGPGNDRELASGWSPGASCSSRRNHC